MISATRRVLLNPSAELGHNRDHQTVRFTHVSLKDGAKPGVQLAEQFGEMPAIGSLLIVGVPVSKIHLNYLSTQAGEQQCRGTRKGRRRVALAKCADIANLDRGVLQTIEHRSSSGDTCSGRFGCVSSERPTGREFLR